MEKTTGNYLESFPDYGALPEAIAKAVEKGELEDVSDGSRCPCFIVAGDRSRCLWAEYKDKAKRRRSNLSRFTTWSGTIISDTFEDEDRLAGEIEKMLRMPRGFLLNRG